MLAFVVKALTQPAISPASYGDEWIIDEAPYFKTDISEEGVYRLPLSLLVANGINLDDINADELQVWSLGQQIPIRVSSEGRVSGDDYIEFYAEPLGGQLDALLYDDPAKMQLNDRISLYESIRPYYITVTNQVAPVRYQRLQHGLNSGGLPPLEPYYIHHEVVTFDDIIHKPTHDGRNFIRYSSMDVGEGQGSHLSSEHDIRLEVEHLSAFGVKPRLQMRFATNALSELWELSADDQVLELLPANGYKVVETESILSIEDLSKGYLDVHLHAYRNSRERSTIAWAQLKYPRLYIFDQQDEIIFHQQSSIINRLLEIRGYRGTSPVMYNVTRGFYIEPLVEGDLVRTSTPASSSEAKWVLVDQETGVHEISDIQKVDFAPPLSKSDYLIISHPSLNTSGEVTAYGAYRESSEGGGYDTEIAYVDQLAERYAYGIQGHPIAIKNALRQLAAQDALPDFTFLIGKGVEYGSLGDGVAALVPTMGIPGSDNLYMQLSTKRHAVKPIGRLAARQPEDVSNYLRKIIAHEHPEDQDQTAEAQAWKKEIIHLSGGSAYNQADLFDFLGDMAEVIETNTFGADVSTFRKTTADPLQRATTEEIMSQIDRGASLLTFFGHAAVGTFDFSLEDPSKYNNAGRNPIILSLGCHSGNIHTSTEGISEEFVLEPDHGAIAFIASTGTAYPRPQYFTGLSMYDLMGNEMYGRTIGEILQHSLEMRTSTDLLSVQTLVEQLTLHGDPAYRAYAFEGPDYIIDADHVRLQPNLVNATTERVELTFDVINIGRSMHDALDINVIHVLPDGTPVDTQHHVIPAPAFSSTVSLDILQPSKNWIGNNRILIHLDPQQRIKEMPDPKAEDNNRYFAADGEQGVSFFVFDNSAKPIYPSDFGISHQEDIVLRAAVNNGLYPGGAFIMQIDTTETFNSPLLESSEHVNESSIIEWRPNIEKLENTVYYWRIAPITDDPHQKSSLWQSASFVYDTEASDGWHQSHYYQWLKDDFYKMSLDADTRQWSYDDREWDVRIKNEIREDGDFWVYVNSVPWSSLNPRGLGSLVQIFAWDRQDVIFNNNGTDYGSIPFSTDAFLYDMQDPQSIQNIISLLQAIPDGSRIFFHTLLLSEEADLHIHDWDKYGLLEYLETQGATRTDDLLENGTVPYTLIYDKGKGVVTEDVARYNLETIDLTTTARALWKEGSITSVRIPTQEQTLRLLWAEEKEETDFSRVLVLGVTEGGRKDTLRKAEGKYDVDLSDIPTKLYPELELVYESIDEAKKTAPMLKYWRVLTKPLPDAAFYTEAQTFDIIDTVYAGEEFEINYDLINLNPTLLQNFLIRYTLVDEAYQEIVRVVAADEIPGGQMSSISQIFNTEQLSGRYQLIVEINPGQSIKEENYCNNLGFASFYVIPDNGNPFIDVTFDQRHIYNGQVVGPRPEIDIVISDPDSYLLLDDQDDWEVTLYYPEIFHWKVDTLSKYAEWRPATDPNDNVAHLVLTPYLNIEGTYTLEIQAKDRAGNYAGTEPYRITFTVDLTVDQPKVQVGPNPVIDYVDFRYLLETDELPPVFRLTIYSADGRLIHHASIDDWGGLRRGINTYRWYPRTASGEQLPTGIYYYEILNSFDTKEEKPRGGLLVVRP